MKMAMVIAQTPNIGAEITGINLSQSIRQKSVAWLEAQLVKHKVIFFRDQYVDSEALLRFAREFGDLETHPVNQKTGFAEIMVLHNNAEKRPSGTAVWHSDVTWREQPSLGSVLVAKKVPKVGGDTLFANMEMAYELIDESIRNEISEMKAIHQFQPMRRYLVASGVNAKRLSKFDEEYPPVVHPLVRTHPVTGQKSIYVNALFTVGIEGVAIGDASRLLDKLYATAQKPEIQCRFRWRKDSIAFWDNRSCQHYATADYFPNERLMERVTIRGDKPF
jgi:taurine dioxygenase